MKRGIYKTWLAVAAMPLLIAGCGPNLATGTPSPGSNVTVVAPSNGNGSAVNNANSGTQTNTTGHSTDESNNENSTDNNTSNPSNTGDSSYTDNGASADSSQPPTLPSAEDKDLVTYTGRVEHIFFHPLIAYPKRAFDGDSMTRGYNDWFVTVSEFNKMIDALYKDNFILIDVRDMFELKQVNDKTVVVKKTLKLPKGKKPLILSIDDMCYYPYMLQNGNVSKLIVDNSGKIATESKNDQGQTVISYDNEIVPILDQFVAAHPDFSFHGEKGMINLTGYAGVLGYRTNELNSPNYETEKADALKVIAALKADGWTFASHGYGHLDDANISLARFEEDTDRWLKEVEPLTGETPVYVYPFGSRPETNSAKWQYLIQKGFHVLCGVGPTTYVEWTSSALMMDRRHMDGIALHEQPKTLMDLFDPEQIIDPARPNVY